MFYKFYEGIFALSVCSLMFTGCGVSTEQVEESRAEYNLANIYDTVQMGDDYLKKSYEYDGAKTENEWMDNILLETKIEEYLLEEVSELNEYKVYISKKSNYEAAMIIDVVLKQQKIKDYSEIYYAVYVGEQWETHQVNWDWFYVSENLDNIFWYSLAEDEFLTLDEWRSSAYYRKLEK